MYTLPFFCKQSQYYSYCKSHKTQLGYSYGMLEYNQVLKHLVLFVPKVGMLSIKSFSIHCIMQLVFLMLIHQIMTLQWIVLSTLRDNRGLLSHLLGKCSDCLSQDASTSPSLSINFAKIALYKNCHKHLPFNQQKTPDICSITIFNLPMCNHEGVTWLWKLSLATTKHHPTYFQQNKNRRKQNQKVLKAVLLFPTHQLHVPYTNDSPVC